jgi:DNA-binding transcriptional regulator YhcF (GntR family)
MNEVEKVKSDVMECFYDANADVGHALNSRLYQHNYVFNYNPKEKAAVKEAFDQLVEQGLIEQNDNNSICITENGVNHLYPGTQQDHISQIKNDILDCFRDAKADVGHAFNKKGFGFKYAQKYNPKKASVLQQAFDELVAEGIIEAKNGKAFLTAHGVETIY